MSIEQTTGRSNIVAERELLTLFQNDREARQAGESHTGTAQTELHSKLGTLVNHDITVYALHENTSPIEIHNKNVLNPFFVTRSGVIAREPTLDGELVFTPHKPSSFWQRLLRRETYYSVQVCDPKTGEPNVGFIIH